MNRTTGPAPQPSATQAATSPMAARKGDDAAPVSTAKPSLPTSWLSLATFSWVTGVISKGYRKQLTHEDLWETNPSEDVQVLRRKFWEHVGADRSTPLTKWGIFRAFVHVAQRDILISGLCMFVYSCAQLANPLVLRGLVNGIADGGDIGLYYAFGLLGVSICGALSSQSHFHFAFTAGRKARALFTSLVYEQTLRLSSAEMAGTSSGEVINMMSADAQKFFEVAQFMHLFWAGPLLLCAAISFLLLVIGLPALAGIGVLLLIAPINLGMAKWKKSLRTAHMPVMDKRVRLCTEVLAGIRVVKLFGWEIPFMNKVKEYREEQLRFVFRELMLFGFVITVLIVTPTVATMATFSAYGATGRVLTSADVFSSLAFFNVLKFPLMQISQAVMMGAQVLVANTRLHRYLNLRGTRTIADDSAVPRRDEQPGSSSLSSSSSPPLHADGRPDDDDVVKMERATFVWRAPGTAESDSDKDGRPTKTKRRRGAKRAVVEGAMDESGSGNSNSAGDNDEGRGGGNVNNTSNSTPFALRNLDLVIKRGQLVACVGPVGSGKSSLLLAMINDLYRSSGSIHTSYGRVAICSQQPWIFNDSVENNILFGQPYDADRFSETLTACCLWADLDQLPDREKTMIGERGVTLSGGQKARVALARAVYAKPDLILLDDPLSALDAHVGKKIFNRLLSPRTGLLRNTTRVLVTHLVHYLGECDMVLVMYNGRIAFQGSFKELQQQTTEQIVHQASQRALGIAPTTTHASTVPTTHDDVDLQLPEASPNVAEAGSLASVIHTILHSTQADRQSRAMSGNGDGDGDRMEGSGGTVAERHSTGQVAHGGGTGGTTSRKLLEKNYTSTRLMTAEERKEGTVNAAIVHQYILASGGYWWMLFVLLLMSLERISYAFADWWLATWTNAAEGPPPSPLYDLPAGTTTEGIRFYTNGYVIAIWINVAFVVIRTGAFMYGGGVAARSLFYRLMWRVVRAPIEFFETTPLGRVTNRVSYDTEIIDDLLVQSLNGMVASSMWMITSVIVMMAVTPLASVVIVPVMLLFFVVSKFYRRSAVDMQRLDSTSRSPIQSSFRETLDGLATVRAYGQQERFLRMNSEAIQLNNSAIFAFVSSNRWLGIRLEIMGGAVTFAVAFFSWMARDVIAPGLVGLAVIWSLNLSVSFTYFVTLSTQAEAKLTSVERVVHYATTLPQEPSLQGDEAAPPVDWPSQGSLTFEKVVMRYRSNLPPAVDNLSFHINPGEHVGVVGRTGAGKSSLSVCMFRLRELEGGSIRVDGIDLSKIGLSDVRGRAFFIIPQEATLFSGSVRSNLDPFNEFTDKQVYSALERARMGTYVREIGGIRAKVEEGGNNFSQGQQQLICLARAILRSPRILVMDEATASVDPESDHYIQETIRSEFRSTTVIEIAHRLHSIMDCDRVMVLDKGKLVEMDSPAALLSNDSGAFTSLVDSTGPTMAKKLRSMVKGSGAASSSASSSSE